MSEETTEQLTETPTLSDVMKALAAITKRLDAQDLQLEAIRQGLVSNDARFDQLEALALEAKSIALINRSQLTILTEEVRRNSIKTLV